MQSIKSISDELSRWVTTNEFHSPSEWLDRAMELTVLLPDLMNEKVKAEVIFEQKILDIMDSAEKKMSKAEAESRAKILPKTKGDMNDYEFYRYLENREKSVMALCQICKKRTETNL